MLSVGRIIAVLVALMVQDQPSEPFVWRYGDRMIGRMTVPTGFVVEAYDYREGIVTTLRYADGSHIVMQVGGMYRIPLFQDAEHQLVSSTETALKKTRIGHHAGSSLCWREDNFKPKKVSGKVAGLLDLFPPNVGYAEVPDVRRAEFDQALNSFVREVDRTVGGR